MTKRHWAALAVLLCVSAAMGREAVPRERPIPDLTGTWCCSFRGMVRYPDGTREYLREDTILYIDQYGPSADLYFNELELWLPGVVGHGYVVGSDSWMDFDYGDCTTLDARIGADRNTLKGNLWFFELTGGQLGSSGGEKDGEEAFLGIFQFTAKRLSRQTRYGP